MVLYLYFVGIFIIGVIILSSLVMLFAYILSTAAVSLNTGTGSNLTTEDKQRLTWIAASYYILLKMFSDTDKIKQKADGLATSVESDIDSMLTAKEKLYKLVEKVKKLF